METLRTYKGKVQKYYCNIKSLLYKKPIVWTLKIQTYGARTKKMFNCKIIITYKTNINVLVLVM